MCLILFANRVIPGVTLQLAANREEFFARPTAPANWWVDHPGILAGRDLRASGTWLGVSRTGRYAAITNFRDPASRRDDAPSRGALVGNFLQGDESPADYLGTIAPGIRDYNGFSLLVGQGSDMWFVSNRDHGAAPVLPGVHGLSNHLLDEPWPKVTRGAAKLAALNGRDFVAEDYFNLLADETQANDHELPHTGVGVERERKSSAIRIRDPIYGTRCSTVLRISSDGQVRFHERTFNADGSVNATLDHQFIVN